MAPEEIVTVLEPKNTCGRDGLTCYYDDGTDCKHPDVASSAAIRCRDKIFLTRSQVESNALTIITWRLKT